jgi:hypothetical protein
MRAALWRELGGFADEYFAYHEDAEISWRAGSTGCGSSTCRTPSSCTVTSSPGPRCGSTTPGCRASAKIVTTAASRNPRMTAGTRG